MGKSGQSEPTGNAATERLAERVVGLLEGALQAPLAPALYLVSTPIGNLADVSLRALSVLARADLVCAEDTRHSRKLLAHYGLAPALQPYHEHNAARTRPRILARLKAGQSVALVADAGTPLISDPGYKLVKAVRCAGFDVTAVPGAAAPIAALSLSGLPADRFFFEGFLPPRSAARRARLEALAAVPATLIFFEAPSRLGPMLADAADVLGARQGAVAKELTKLHEQVRRGSLEALARDLEDGFKAKGEFVVLVAPPGKVAVSDAEIEVRLIESLAEHSVRDAARNVADALGVGRNRVYRLALALSERTP